MKANRKFNVVRLTHLETARFARKTSAVRGLALFYAEEIAAKTGKPCRIADGYGRVIKEISAGAEMKARTKKG